MRSTRRAFLGSAIAGSARAVASGGDQPDTPGTFRTDAAKLQQVYDAACQVLRQNCRTVAGYPKPVLIEGSVYRGIWLECGPHEGLVYSLLDPAVARANQEVFFHLQRGDGYLPCWVRTEIGAGQIQMVVPIAATAFELVQRLGDADLLEKAYHACARWDAWLERYRNTRKTGLCEAFCEYDTGHDNSPRWRGMPKTGRDQDARLLPKGKGLPRLAPDLSATVYGGRRALAGMARALNKREEAATWLEKAEAIRKKIVDMLYDPKDACFYDLDSDGNFVRIRGDLLTRVLGEHVVDGALFAEIYSRQIHNPKAFWAPYPLPSIALDDPSFVRPIPKNSWGGASQALTALRAPRWMEHYGKYADMAHMMRQWAGAILRTPGWLSQLDPLTGEFTRDVGDYSPTALVLVDYIWRLHGIREEGGRIEWNCRLPEGASRSMFSLKSRSGTLELAAEGGAFTLRIAGRNVLRVRGTGRVITDASGKGLQLVGTNVEAVRIHLDLPGGVREYHLKPDQIEKI